MDTLGMTLGIGAAIFWGSYLVPIKTLKISEGSYTLAMGVGIGFLVLGLSPWSMKLFDDPYQLGLSMLAGIIWSLGNVASLYAVRNLGFSRAVPVFSIATLINALYGILLFGELESDILRIEWLFLAIGLLMGGITLAQFTYGRGKRMDPSMLLVAIATGLLFGSYNAPIRATTLGPLSAVAGLFLGMVITCIILGLWLRSRENVSKKKGETIAPFLTAMISGLIWGVGTILSILSIFLIGLTLSFPIFQLNVLIYVLWGLLYFKEVKKRFYTRVLLGTLMIIIGATIVVII